MIQISLVKFWYVTGNGFFHCPHLIGYTGNTSVTVEYCSASEVSFRKDGFIDTPFDLLKAEKPEFWQLPSGVLKNKIVINDQSVKRVN
jgi:hypothetical protein